MVHVGKHISPIERLGMLSFFSWLDQAVQQNGQSLQHASDELQLDPELQEVVGSLKIRCPGKLLQVGGGFKCLFVSPRTLGKIPILIFFKWVEATNHKNAPLKIRFGSPKNHPIEKGKSSEWNLHGTLW